MESGADSIGHFNASDSPRSSTDDLSGELPTTHVSGRSLLSTKKRKRVEGGLQLEADQTNVEEQKFEDELGDDLAFELTELSPKKQKISRFSGIRLPSFVFPKSQYEGWRPHLPIAQEKDVLSEFLVRCYIRRSQDNVISTN